jgi:CxxC motif-containing protein (DUF1111 family)
MIATLMVATGCSGDDDEPIVITDPTEYSDEWYAGGVNGTIFNATARAYKQPIDAINADMALYRQFMRGEELASKSFVSADETGYSGLGPVYIRKSCIACHPSYGGHSKRVDVFDTSDSRNGYLLMIYDPASPTLALASKYFTGMTQTRAVPPFKAPIDESGITLKWMTHTDEYGNKYEDGTPYSAGTDHEGTLIYPIVEIAQEAILFSDFDMSKHAASIEATIGIYGVGLIDAISDEDLRAQWADEQARGYAMGVIGADIIETPESNPYFPGAHPGRFTYLLTRGTLDNGPGANALWNITNVTRPDRTYNYITTEYARVMSEDAGVQAALGQTGEEIYDLLTSTSLKSEMTMEDFEAFMVWHRGIAVPAARNLDDEVTQHGRDLFYETGCTACHRPSWTTRSDYPPLQALASQKIYPYTDLLRHDLDMKEPGRARVCRTTPLWGRGLLQVTSGHTDMLHDLRARNYEEAILWHGGEARTAKETFRKMPKSDREALIKFLGSI